MKTTSYRPGTRTTVTHLGHLRTGRDASGAAEPSAPADAAALGADHRALIADVARFLQRRPERLTRARPGLDAPDRGMWPVNGEHSSAARVREVGAGPRRGGTW